MLTLRNLSREIALNINVEFDKKQGSAGNLWYGLDARNAAVAAVRALMTPEDEVLDAGINALRGKALTREEAGAVYVSVLRAILDSAEAITDYPAVPTTSLVAFASRDLSMTGASLPLPRTSCG